MERIDLGMDEPIPTWLAGALLKFLEREDSGLAARIKPRRIF
jgi:hypothetical protein